MNLLATCFVCLHQDQTKEHKWVVMKFSFGTSTFIWVIVIATIQAVLKFLSLLIIDKGKKRKRKANIVLCLNNTSANFGYLPFLV
jgi:heme/copper-type cytochrome/quinol oxidase subunit 4